MCLIAQYNLLENKYFFLNFLCLCIVYACVLRYPPTCVHAEARGRHPAPSIAFHFSMETGALPEPGTHQFSL